MRPRAIRFSEKTIKELEATGRQRGFASPSAFIRYAVKQELGGREEGLTGGGERIAASVEQVRRDLSRLARAQQALFAYRDTPTRAVLPCLPGPPPPPNTQALAPCRATRARP